MEPDTAPPPQDAKVSPANMGCASATKRASDGTLDQTSQKCDSIPNDGATAACSPGLDAKDGHGVRMGVRFLLNSHGKPAQTNSESGNEGAQQQNPADLKSGNVKHQSDGKRENIEVEKENDRGLANRENDASVFGDGPQSPIRSHALPTLEPLPQSPRYSPRTSPQQRHSFRDPLCTPAHAISPATHMMGLLDPIEPMFIPDGGGSGMVGMPGGSLESPAPIEQSSTPSPPGQGVTHPSTTGDKNEDGPPAQASSSDSKDSQRHGQLPMMSEKEKSPSTLTPRTILPGQATPNMHGYDFNTSGFDSLGYGSIIGLQHPDLLQTSISSPSDPSAPSTSIPSGCMPSSAAAPPPPFWSGNMALGNFGQVSSAPTPNNPPTVTAFASGSNLSAASNHLNAAIQQQLAHLNCMSANGAGAYQNPMAYPAGPPNFNPLAHIQQAQAFNFHVNLASLDQNQSVAPVFAKPSALPLGAKGGVAKAPKPPKKAQNVGARVKTPKTRVSRRVSQGKNTFSALARNLSNTAPVGMTGRLMTIGGHQPEPARSVGGPSGSRMQPIQALSRGEIGPSGKKLFPCSQCGFVFGMRSNLKRHVSTVHEDQRMFTCEVCPASFGLKQNLVTHVRVKHERRRPFSCDTCGQKFGYKQVLQNHVRNIHTDQRVDH